MAGDGRFQMPDIEAHRPRWMPRWLWEFAYVGSGQFDRDFRWALMMAMYEPPTPAPKGDRE